ncbi:MAG: hypothetical protein E7544_02530 [Ruminococcaceae bacterium]|nr:hypothetical protein [Oscillospiraceae bacterium]
MDINALLIHKDHYDAIRLLNDEEAGIILKAIFEYFISGTEPEFEDRALNILFLQLKKFCDTNRKRYEEVCKKKSENARKRWDAYKKTGQDQSMQMHAAEGKEKENEISNSSEKENPNENPNENTNENTNENSNAISNVKENEKADPNTNVSVNEKSEDTALLCNNGSNNFPENTYTHKKAYGEFSNVFLSDEEYLKLIGKHPDGRKKIESLSAYIKATGKVYRDHYAQLLNWQSYERTTPEYNTASKPKPPGERREPTFDVSEFTKKAVGIKYVPPEDD